MFLMILIISSVFCVFKHIGNASTPANSLNKIALPSITGRLAEAPILPRPKTALPSVIIATIFPLEVYLYISDSLSLIRKQGSATPGLYAKDRSSLFSILIFDSTEIFPLCLKCNSKLLFLKSLFITSYP